MPAMSAVVPIMPSATHGASPAAVRIALNLFEPRLGPNPPAMTAAASRATATRSANANRLIGRLVSLRSVRYQ